MPSTPGTDSYVGRYMLCIAALAVSLVLFPLIALVPTVVAVHWPAWLGNGLFFWPQWLLLLNGFESVSSTTVYGATLAPWVAAAFWLVVVAGWTRLTLAWRAPWALLALFVAVVITTELVVQVLRGLGFRVVLDGL